MRRTLLLTAALSFVWFGCHRPAPSAAADAGAPEVDAGPPPPPELSLTLRVAQPDGGTDEFPLTTEDTPTIPVTQHIEIQTNEPLRNGRIRVLDEADRVMASDEQLEQSDAGIRDQLSFTQPLLGGHKYTVVLDAQNPASDILDARGTVVPEKRLTFQTGGEREQPPSPAKKKPAAKHKRRRH